MEHLFSIASGYFIGSIPFSFIIAKLKGVNLKERVKNGQIGAAAVKRSCGIFPAILAGSGDFSKGALAVYLARRISGQDWIIVLTGLAVIIGHNWSIFLNFWGGKGGLVSMGILFYLLTIPFLASIYLLIPFFLIKNRKILRVPKTSLFSHLGYLSISVFSFILSFPFILSVSPIIFSLPMILKKNY